MKQTNPNFKQTKINLLNSQREVLSKNHPLFENLLEITSKNHLYKKYIWPLQALLKRPENSQALQIVKKVEELKVKIREINNLSEITKQNLLEIAQLQDQIINEKAKITLELFEKVSQITAKLENFQYGRIAKLENSEAVEILQKLILDNSNTNRTIFPAQTLFISNQDFQNQFRNHTKVITLKVDKVFPIPIYMFASAHGLYNWHGRKADRLKDGQNSSQVIQKYAKLQAETMPPVFDLECYVYPNGEVYLVSGNSHRVAAAFVRSDKNIPFNGSCTIYLIDKQPPIPKYEEQALQNLQIKSKK